MDFQGICDRLRAIGSPGLVSLDEPRKPNPDDKDDRGRSGLPFVLADREHVIELLFCCRGDERLRFEQLIDLSATDPSKDDESLWVGYELLSVARKHRLTIKCIVPKSDPRIASATAVYNAARWHERECAEMFGITFVGHPDPRHILLPDDWVGYPMRKDYEFPTEYHGISCV